MKEKLLVIFLMALIWLSAVEFEDEGSLLAVLFHQTAAEYYALCHQAYNLAEDRLVEMLKVKREKPAAVIVDVDETVLGNSVYNARELLHGQEYPQDFYKWLEEMKSEPVAGALEFLLLADSLGVKIYYITNRRDHKQHATIGNLQKYGFPQAVEAQVLCKNKESSKETRRQQVMADHEVLLLIGDNLLDFSDCFDGRSVQERHAAVQEWRKDFGRKYIVLPNAMHGYWEKVINDFEYNLSAEELQKKRLKHLKY